MRRVRSCTRTNNTRLCFCHSFTANSAAQAAYWTQIERSFMGSLTLRAKFPAVRDLPVPQFHIQRGALCQRHSGVFVFDLKQRLEAAAQLRFFGRFEDHGLQFFESRSVGFRCGLGGHSFRFEHYIPNHATAEFLVQRGKDSMLVQRKLVRPCAAFGANRQHSLTDRLSARSRRRQLPDGSCP